MLTILILAAVAGFIRPRLPEETRANIDAVLYAVKLVALPAVCVAASVVIALFATTLVHIIVGAILFLVGSYTYGNEPEKEEKVMEPIRWGEFLGIVYTLWPWGITLVAFGREIGLGSIGWSIKKVEELSDDNR